MRVDSNSERTLSQLLEQEYEIEEYYSKGNKSPDSLAYQYNCTFLEYWYFEFLKGRYGVEYESELSKLLTTKQLRNEFRQ